MSRIFRKKGHLKTTYCIGHESSMQSKYWCFTINNFGVDEILQLRNVGRRLEEVSFVIFGREGRSTTPHIQGYVEFSTKTRLRSATRLIGRRAHMERRRGTSVEAAEYCRKENDYEEFGSISVPHQGMRTDLLEIQRSIDRSTSEMDIARDYFTRWVVYRRSFSAYRQLLLGETNREPPRVILLWGGAGTGKTRIAYQYDPNLWSCPSPTLEWFDGYNGQETVLFDDFIGEGVNGGTLLRILDRYPIVVPVKGGFVVFRPRTIFLTANVAPLFGLVIDISAFRRRIHSTYRFGLGHTELDFSDEHSISVFVERLRVEPRHNMQ